MTKPGLYKMSTISQRTGFSPALLRAWERRHGLLDPQRTEGGHRLYTDDDLAVLAQVKGRVDAFVHSVGTAGSIRGIATRLREHDGDVRIVAVEPAESCVLSGGPSGSHKIEGTGAGFVVPLWEDALADEIETVSTDEAMQTARRLAREEALFAGTSTGANVAAALRVAERLGEGRTIVTIACDTGMKYLSTPLYAEG